MFPVSSFVRDVSVWFIPVVTAITLHEAAHGFVAHLRGDETAWRMGRVGFNPVKHVDPFGTIVRPALLLLLRAPVLACAGTGLLAMQRATSQVSAGAQSAVFPLSHIWPTTMLVPTRETAILDGEAPDKSYARGGE